MNGVDILMIAACTIVWVSVVFAFRWLIPFSMVWYNILLSILLFVVYLFIVYYSPIKTDYDASISNAKQDYLNNKDKLDQMYVDQLKTTWENDTMDRNKYFILMFIILFLLPIPHYAVYLMGHNPKQPTSLDELMKNVTIPMTLAMLTLIGIVAVLLWGIYTLGIMYMMYILLSVVVGIGLFWFVIFYKQWLSLPKAFGIIALLGIIAMLVLAVTVMGWWMNMGYILLAIMVVGFFLAVLLAIMVVGFFLAVLLQ
jgi:hypothetical protein